MLAPQEAGVYVSIIISKSLANNLQVPVTISSLYVGCLSWFVGFFYLRIFEGCSCRTYNVFFPFHLHWKVFYYLLNLTITILLTYILCTNILHRCTGCRSTTWQLQEQPRWVFSSKQFLIESMLLVNNEGTSKCQLLCFVCSKWCSAAQRISQQFCTWSTGARNNLEVSPLESLTFLLMIRYSSSAWKISSRFIFLVHCCYLDWALILQVFDKL